MSHNSAPIDLAALIRDATPGGDLPTDIAIACSGGPDSLGLLLLACDLARGSEIGVHVLVVNHGLRDEAEDEARRTIAHAEHLGIPATLLRWIGAKPKSNIQSAAREARYSLMRDWCLENGIPALLTAHHLEDQAETFLLRLGRGSGVDGLGAMHPWQDLGEVALIRPLLDIPKQILLDRVAESGLTPISDPSNKNKGFARVRMRGLLPGLATEGLTARRLAETARQMRRARDALDQMTDAHLHQHAKMAATGAVTLDPMTFAADVSDEIALRALSRVLTRVGGSALPPRFSKVTRLLSALRAGELGAGRTCAGCRVLRRGSDTLICREYNAARAAALSGEYLFARGRAVWDGRFEIQLTNFGPPNDPVRRAAFAGLSVAPLGPDGWRQAVAENKNLKRESTIPGVVRSTLPAFWEGARLVAAPHIGLEADFSATITPIHGRLGFSFGADNTI